MSPTIIQTVSAVFTMLAGVGAIIATLVCLKISQQISQLEARILSRLADQYATKEEFRTLRDMVTSVVLAPSHPNGKAAHA